MKRGILKMKKEVVLNEIKELLLNDVELLKDVVTELNCWNNCLDNLQVYVNDYEFFDMFFLDNPAEVARAIFFGDYNYNDDYVKFNAYMNLESLNELEYEELLKDNIADIIEHLEENYNNIFLCDGELKILLEEIEEIEELKEIDF